MLARTGMAWSSSRCWLILIRAGPSEPIGFESVIGELGASTGRRCVSASDSGRRAEQCCCSRLQEADHGTGTSRELDAGNALLPGEEARHPHMFSMQRPLAMSNDRQIADISKVR